MQLTRFDRWLREKFVHEIHIYSLRPPEVLPAKVRAEELPEKPGQRFKHHYTVNDAKTADVLISEFKAHNQMFTTRIKDRTGWWVRFIAPQGKSVSWWCLWVLLSAIGVYIVGGAVRSVWQNPDFRKNLDEAIEIMKG